MTIKIMKCYVCNHSIIYEIFLAVIEDDLLLLAVVQLLGDGYVQITA
ncbi:Uncharacterised protein [Klebsiella pneumoniae]|nr:Uncharacterised protein [Klebsiella pneumoniae]